MNTLSALLAALAASSTSAFTNVRSANSAKTVHEPSSTTTSLRNALRDLSGMASEGDMMMGQYADFSRSPRGSDAGYGRQRHGYDHSSRGFDPFSAYGGGYAMSQRGGPGGEYYPDMMPMGRMNGGQNGVRNDNTMGGFSYDSRTSGRFNDQFGPPGGHHGGPSPGRDQMGPYPGQMQGMGGGPGYGGQFGPGGGGEMYDQYGPPELMGMYGDGGYGPGPMMDGGFMDGEGGDMQQDMGRLGP